MKRQSGRPATINQGISLVSITGGLIVENILERAKTKTILSESLAKTFAGSCGVYAHRNIKKYTKTYRNASRY